MRLRIVLVLFLPLAASPLTAQEVGRVRDPRAAWAPSVFTKAGPLGAEPFLYLGLKPIGPLVPPDFAPPPRLDSLWTAGRPGERTAAWAAAVTARLVGAPSRSAWADLFGARAAARLLASSIEAPGPDPPSGRIDSFLPDALAEIADLGIQVFGRGELGGAWSRFRPCDPALQLNCNPTLFPLLSPELQFGVQVQGTISDRIHVDVDYDQRREFGPANTLNVYYQGLAGEVLQRVEVGDVSIELPASRFLTEGVPGGNFGFKATGQLGALDFQAIWAQQKGDVATREFRIGGAGAVDGLVQESRVVLDDGDYVTGQFFFLVDPSLIAGYPHLDVLSLQAETAPAIERPAAGGVGIQLYRDERPSFSNPQQQAQLGYFLADAVTADGSLRHGGRFRRLVPGEDYLVHGSGLWIMLRSPLRPDEALAAAFVTDAGVTVGTPDAERSPAGVTPVLRLIRGPVTIHQPGQPTWPLEMHHIYRIAAASELEPGSVELRISLGELAAGATHREIGGRSVSFLKLFGLDEDVPYERLDEARIFQPGRSLFDDDAVAARFPGSYVVFPTLRPFAEPAPVASEGLSAGDALAALGTDANAAIYEDPDPVRREGSSRFRLTFDYRVRQEAFVSSFDLGAFGIREGSETLTVDGRPLRRGVDYTIDYQLGVVTLTNPQAVFGARPGAELRATWEQKAAFQLAPTSLYGLSGRYRIGQIGEVNLVGLYQAEKALVSRPQLGLEPGSIALGGASTELRFGAPWLDRALVRLGGLGGELPSRIRLHGELGVSVPNPNRSGQTYVDDFEAADEVRVALDRWLWRLGSRPDDPSGATDVLPAELDVATAASLVWQHDYLDAAGRVTGPRLTREIDRQINVAGAERSEPVLYLTFGADAPQDGTRRWRSITTVLETTGRDLSRSEYLEFYASARPGQQIALVVDLGTVGEDAFHFDAQGRTRGTYPDGRPWGLGVLDEEARTAAREIWGPALDTLGLWNQSCLAEGGRHTYPLGDPRANCARGNGRVDTEDLDGNGVLDADDGPLFRYVVRLDASSPYRVRGPAETGTEFALYRIPLRGPGAIPLHGATEGSWRYIKHLRITVTGLAGAAGPDVVLARMRILGSRWMKRDVHGILAGIHDDRPGIGEARTEFRVGPVSRITDGDVYSPPPGVGDELHDPTSAFGGSSVEFNEKSLRLAYRDLEPGDRVESYFRYPQQPRNFLSYRQLRLWAVARGGRWNETDGERLVVSVGTDPRNRYLFVSRLRRSTATGPIRPEDWLPELTIDFGRWFELKAEAERALIEGAHAPGEPVVVWSADGAYGVVLEDRARAPNLAAVRELAIAVYNAGGVPTTGEVWINDLRLGGKDTEPGVAGRVELDLEAGGFAAARIAYTDRGGSFRQRSEGGDYVGARELSVGGTVQLGQLAPRGWALEAPVAFSHSRSGLDPLFLERSDVLADRLEGLRATGTEHTHIAFSLRRSEPSADPWLGLLVDGASLRFAYHTSEARAITTRDRTDGFEAGIGYERRPVERSVGLVPGAVESLLRELLPRAVEETDLFRRLTRARLRWSPEAVSYHATYVDQASRSWRYASILESDADRAVRPVVSPREALETHARVAFRPFASLTAALSLTSGRDLLPSGEAAAGPEARAALDGARSRVAGVDVGWERLRILSTNVDFRPAITSWLRPGFGYAAHYRANRSPSYWERPDPNPDDGDEGRAVLQRAMDAERRVTRSLAIDPGGLVATITGGSDAEDDEGAGGALRRLGRALGEIDLVWSDGLGSRYEWEAVDPSLGYQLGLGSLDRVREIDGRPAAQAAERGSFRARAGVRLPLAAGLDVAYGESTSEVLELRGGRRTADQRSWPELRLSWSELPLPRSIRAIVVHASAGVGYRHQSRTSIFGGHDGQAWTGEEETVPLQLTIGLGNGMSMSYTGGLSRGESRDPTGGTEQSGGQHSLQLYGTFLPPDALRESFPSPVRVALRYGYEAQRHCRLAAASGDAGACTPFIDLIHREFSLMLDTIVSQLTVGFQVSYNDRRSFVGTRSGSSQFQLGVYGEFNVSAGRTFAGGVQ